MICIFLNITYISVLNVNKIKITMKTCLLFHSTPFVLISIAVFAFYSCRPEIVHDIDGNVYKTIIIENQEWFAENLKTTTYNEGQPIEHVVNNDTWRSFTNGAYCWYDNDLSNKNTYGAIYNWYAVESGKLCPEGWRVPSDEDWTDLTDTWGIQSLAGGAFKARGTLDNGTGLWKKSDELSGFDQYGFSALPGGSRRYGHFSGIGLFGVWWTSTDYIDVAAFGRSMAYDSDSITRRPFYKTFGFSVRCVRDL
jgi:uncharacterized protein (TIGR02145 family)